MSLTLLDIVLIIGMSQGFFLALSIQLLPNKNKYANRTLAIVLVIASLAFIVRALPFRISGTDIRLGVIGDATIFAFGPLLYSYIRQLTFNEKPRFRLSWYHYIPIFLNFIYFIWTLTFSLEDLYKFIRLGKLNYLFFLIELGGLISISFYWFKSFLIVKKFNSIQKDQLSFNQKVVNYLIFVLAALFLFLISWTFTFISLYFFRNYSEYINYSTMWLVAPLFIFFIGFFSITQPTIFRLPMEKKTVDRVIKTRLKPEEIDLLKSKLQKLIVEDNIYSAPQLNLNALSEAMNTSPNNLSWLLNQVYHKSFYEYINQFRIVDFLDKIKDKQHHSKTILAIAMESGFNSKSTFNKAFKTIMKDTPSNYIKQKFPN